MPDYGPDFWNARFADDGYRYGTEPADFVRRHAPRLPPAARVLVPADGEGRNGVYLASLGHTVVTTEVSEAAIAKSRRLAEARGVTLTHGRVDLRGWTWPVADFDAVVAVFVQFAPPDERRALFEGLKQATRPGGLVLLHGYTPEQLALGTGGPRDAAHLYTTELLRDAFADWAIEHLEAYRRTLDEGEGHRGPSALIDLVARRP